MQSQSILRNILKARKQSSNNYNQARDRGSFFEKLVKHYFEHDSKYKNRFKQVWLWHEFPQKNLSDHGIDIVAEEDDGTYCAIQCKWYDEERGVITKDDIDSFLSASGKEGYSSRIFVSTTDKWSKQAENAIQNQAIKVSRISIVDLEESDIDWNTYLNTGKINYKKEVRKELREYQKEAIAAVKKGLDKADRGQLIMACGTGKTFTSLKIMEEILNPGSIVLFLVPSLALLNQTHKEWSEQTDIKLKQFAICSDSSTGKDEDYRLIDLEIPATTNSQKIVTKAIPEDNEITVIYSTYHSIEVINEAQKIYGLREIDLIICDEAHRTTGSLDSFFTKIHDNEYIVAKKRLYMTATPRVYTENSKQKANDNNIIIYSMDDKIKYGEELYKLSFKDAVEQKLLTDYQVLIFVISEDYINAELQDTLSGKDNKELKVDDVGKIIGCWNSLSKNIKNKCSDDKLIQIHELTDISNNANQKPMQRAIAFMNTIQNSNNLKEHFTKVVDKYKEQCPDNSVLECKVEHIDGKMNSIKRKEVLAWLKAEDISENECRILTNAKCLSEGVDVPSLDAIIFFESRSSQIDIIQAVGRVMRLAPNKDLGYVIIPIVAKSGVKPEEALANNKQFQTIWQILNALIAHDDRMNAFINSINISQKNEDIGGNNITGSKDGLDSTSIKEQLALSLKYDPKLKDYIYATIANKLGSKNYWPSWAEDIANIAQSNINRITSIIQQYGDVSEVFNKFLKALQENVNPSIEKEELIEMLAQHMVTKPVFNALFKDNNFSNNNPVSRDLEAIVKLLEKYNVDNENKDLQKLYKSVEDRAKNLQNSLEGQQSLIIELYDNFFKKAFPKMAQRLGIVYTPIEVVDFIIHSVEEVLKKEFNTSLNAENINIIDPFTGTGTFIVRLLQSGLITEDKLEYKYQNEIHANEIVLLSYYIAAVNIEMAYNLLKNEYKPFDNIVLTDTFNLTEKVQGNFEFIHLVQNSKKINKQKSLPIKVIIGNPPYSSGQTSENDNNKNLKYESLDAAIKNTYIENSLIQGNKNSVYDSYIRAFRWASDRLNENTGVVAFVTNGSYIESNAMDGLRKSFLDDFTKVYCFNLRGNQRTSGETSRKEGGKIFGSGSRAPIAITILVKTTKKSGPGQLFYYDIGDYLKREEKLAILNALKHIGNVDWQCITPNKNHDWINQRNNQEYETFLSLGDKKDPKAKTIFTNYSCGIKTNRDSWAYNYSKDKLAENMANTISVYNQELIRYQEVVPKNIKGSELNKFIDDFVTSDPKKISWSSTLKNYFRLNKILNFQPNCIRLSFYRPFSKQYLYYNKYLNECMYQIPKIFSTPKHHNLAIGTVGKGSNHFSAFIVNQTPDYSLVSCSQWFPLYTYKPVNRGSLPNINANNLFNCTNTEQLNSQTTINNNEEDHLEEATTEYTQEENISNEILQQYQYIYKDNTITKEDIFYYIYGLLNSKEYIANYCEYLIREIPKIPFVENFKDFVKAGKELAYLHLNYETIEPYPYAVVEKSFEETKESHNDTLDLFNKPTLDESSKAKAKIDSQASLDTAVLYKVGKMKYKSKEDKSTIIYNNFIKIKNIPKNAYDYVVNGKSAIDWVIDRYQVKQDKNTGIVNDPNLYSKDPEYILNLLLQVINVSVKSVEIINSLPPLKIIRSI